MRTLTLLFTLIIGIASSTLAQDSKTIKIEDFEQEQINTVFKKNKRDGFYLSWSNGYTPINNEHGIYTSARIAWIMDHWFAFGVVGTGFIGNIDNLDNALMTGSYNEPNSLAGGYGGILVEPILLPTKPVHVSFPIIFGAGGVGVIDNYIYNTGSSYGDVFYVVEPGIELEMNFTRWLRIGLYGSYRYTSDIHIDNIDADALRNYSAGVTFKVGLF